MSGSGAFQCLEIQTCDFKVVSLLRLFTFSDSCWINVQNKWNFRFQLGHFAVGDILPWCCGSLGENESGRLCGFH